MKNKKIWDWIVLILKNNEIVNMWLVKYYQTFYEIKKKILCVYV